MLENFTNEIESLKVWHERAKEVTIIAESMDDENKAYIQPLHEQRYSYDHFMRAVSYQQEGESEEIVKKALESSIGHLQRAYCDSVEWILISAKEMYVETLKEYTNAQIITVFPKYYSEIRPAFDDITKAVDQYKINKSVEKDVEIMTDDEMQTLKVIANSFLAQDLVKQLRHYIELLRNKEGSLIEQKIRDEKEKRKEIILYKIMLPIATAIISGIIVALLVS